MMVFNRQMMTGAAIALLTGLAVAQPSVAGPLSQRSESLFSQVNRPESEGIPALNTEEVRGRVTRVEGDQVELRLSNGELRTYSLSPTETEQNRPAVGSDVILTVRGNAIVAINSTATTGATGTSQSGETASSDTMQSGSTQSGSASSSTSSSTTVRRQTTVQQTTPQQTTTPAPTPSAQPEPQPVRGLW